MEHFLYGIGFFIIHIDILFLLICCVGLYFFKKKWGKIFFGIGFMLMTIINLTNVYMIPGRYLEETHQREAFNADEIEGFILLGGTYSLKDSTTDHVIFNLAGSRLLDFLKLLQQYPHKKIIFTGTPLEANITKQYLLDFGINPSLLCIENASKNTEDNALNTAKLLGDYKNKKWVLVTSAFHMKRSVLLFKAAGVNIIPYPVDYHVPTSYSLGLSKGGNLYFAAILKEYLGLFNLWRKSV